MSKKTIFTILFVIMVLIILAQTYVIYNLIPSYETNNKANLGPISFIQETDNTISFFSCLNNGTILTKRTYYFDNNVCTKGEFTKYANTRMEAISLLEKDQSIFKNINGNKIITTFEDNRTKDEILDELNTFSDKFSIIKVK